MDENLTVESGINSPTRAIERDYFYLRKQHSQM